MSLNRIALRMATMAAITNFGRAPYPTLAGKEIFDSKIEPTEAFEGSDPVPLAVIYTDYDKDFWPFGAKAHQKRNLTLTLELLVVQTAEVKGDDGVVGYEIGYPTTDSELEFSLDMFELQVFEAFKADNLASACLRHLIGGYENIISRRGASVEGGQRLSARQITIETLAVRDTAPGHIAPAVAAFLDAVEEHYRAYRSRARLLRAEYLKDRGVTADALPAHVFGHTAEAGEQIGYASGPPVLLGTPVQWLDPQGRPL